MKNTGLHAVPPPAGGCPEHLWQGFDFGVPAPAPDRLPQGPFAIEDDGGWLLAGSSTPDAQYRANPGMGFVGYAWEESGPSLMARAGRETLEQHLSHLLAFPFTDVLYIRCDWRDVQSAPGQLALSPIWEHTFDMARKAGKRVAFRIQSSQTGGQPERYSLPDFLRQRIPYVTLRKFRTGSGFPDTYQEPDYTSPAFFDALCELNRLLANRFDGDPALEFVDLMMYGFWGEGHTGGYHNPLPYQACEDAFLKMTAAQMEIWRHTPLAVNVQTDISRAGNRAVQELCMRQGTYLRTDSVLINEPSANEHMAHRPPHTAGIIEDGYFRYFDPDDPRLAADSAGVTNIENTILHTLDLGGSYFSLWTEGQNLQRYYARYPDAFNALGARMGYRVRPSWVYQRKRGSRMELVLMLHNDGVASIPGRLRLSLYAENGSLLSTGTLDAGQPFAGRTRQCAFLLPEGYIARTVSVAAALRDKKGERPIRWACGQNIRPDGRFEIELQPADSTRWRKDV